MYRINERVELMIMITYHMLKAAQRPEGYLNNYVDD